MTAHAEATGQSVARRTRADRPAGAGEAKVATGRGTASAARAATDRHSTLVPLPGLGDLHLPPPDQLAFLAGLGLLAALEVVEWPVAVALAVGHTLVNNRSNKVVREFGEALEGA